VREEVEALEHHANQRPLPCKSLSLLQVRLAVADLNPHQLAGNPDPAPVNI
jgi:hypothetical protein